MSNQEAIALLRNLEDALDSYCELNEEGKTAFRMAIEALSRSENPNNSDCISRQAAIDEVVAWLKDRMSDKKNGKPLTERLRDLPSAQPEIIHCRDCKYQDKGSNERESWNLCEYRPWMYVPINDDHYCRYAERRTDETD